MEMGKKDLSERDICTKFITPAIIKAGWDAHKQILEEVSFTDGKIYVVHPAEPGIHAAVVAGGIEGDVGGKVRIDVIPK